MRRFFAVLIALASVAAPVSAVVGVADVEAGASLVVPFFEVGIDVEENAHDTLLAVHNIASAPVTIHWTVWMPSGAEATSLSGNFTIPGAGVWSKSMRDLTRQQGSAEDLEAITYGDFYRGFLTIDTVTEPTDLNPHAATYPFSRAAALEGYIYYARLGEGSANGLRMLSLEPIGGTEHPFLRDFYAASQGTEDRERIDARARLCAETLIASPDIEDCLDSFDGEIFRIRGRGFLVPQLNGQTRFVVFAWNTFRPTAGGPSKVCDLLGCESTYTLRRYVESGDLEETREIRLDDVVTVIEFTEGSIGGIISIRDIPDPDRALQVFAFSFNSAKPPGSDQNWDAIFEGYVVP